MQYILPNPSDTLWFNQVEFLSFRDIQCSGLLCFDFLICNFSLGVLQSQ